MCARRECVRAASPQSRDRRRSERSSLAWGLFASVVLHALILSLPADIDEPRPRHRGGVARRAGPGSVRMLVVRIAPVDAGEEIRLPVVPSPLIPPLRATPSVPDGASALPVNRGAITPAGGPAKAGAGASALVPSVRDARLFVLPVPPGGAFRRARDGIAARFQPLRDSVRAEVEVARRATDWTVADGAGRRWGLSPNCIDLGGLSLCEPNSRAGERMACPDTLAILQRDRVLLNERREERIRAIRERRERERAHGGG